MASKKFYSDDDIQLAKAALSELPDLMRITVKEIGE